MHKGKRDISRPGEKLIWGLTVALLSSFLIFNLNTMGSIVLFVLSFAIFVISTAQRGFKINIKFGAMHGFVFTFGIFCLVSSLWAWNRAYAIEKGITVLEILVCMSMLYIHYDQYDSVEPLLQAIKWSGFVVSIYYLFTYGFQAVLTAIIDSSRAPTTFANVNNIAMLASYAIIIAFNGAIHKHKYITFTLVTVPCIIMIAASGSRKALIALVLGVFYLFVRRNASRNQFYTLLRIAIALFAMYYAIVSLSTTALFAGIAERMQGIINFATGAGKVDHSTLLRQVYIELGIEQFLKNPILGIGIGCPRLLAYASTGHNAYLHNNYVELLAGGGVFGFVLYYVMYAYIIYNLFKGRKEQDSSSNVVIIMMIILLVVDYGAVSYYFKDMYFYFLIFFLHTRNLRYRISSNDVNQGAPTPILQ